MTAQARPPDSVSRYGLAVEKGGGELKALSTIRCALGLLLLLALVLPSDASSFAATSSHRVFYLDLRVGQCAADLRADEAHVFLDTPESVPEVREFLSTALADQTRRVVLLELANGLLRRSQDLIARWGVIMTDS